MYPSLKTLCVALLEDDIATDTDEDTGTEMLGSTGRGAQLLF